MKKYVEVIRHIDRGTKYEWSRSHGEFETEEEAIKYVEAVLKEIPKEARRRNEFELRYWVR